MNRSKIALALVLCLACSLNACSLAVAGKADSAMTTTTSSSSQTSDDELPPGFYLGGEFVELGPFDPTDPELEPIRACEEIPEEVLAKAGLAGPPSAHVDIADSTGCTLQVSEVDTNVVATITSGTAATQALVNDGRLLNPAPSELIDGLVAHQFELDEGRSCQATTDTSRGHLAIVVDDFSQSTSEEALCFQAVEFFESLIFLLRGNNHDQN